MLHIPLSQFCSGSWLMYQLDFLNLMSLILSLRPLGNALWFCGISWK